MDIPKIQCGIALGVSLEGLIDALADEGFRPKRLEDGYISFTRNDKAYVATCVENEDALLVLSKPRIYQISEHDNRGSILATVNEINRNNSPGKVFICDDAVWVSVEVRHQRMGAAADLLSTYIDDIDAVVNVFNARISTSTDGQSDTQQ